MIQIILLVSVSQSLGAVHNVVSFGAIADGKTLNTTAIQSAIDAANKDGGGVVSIPKGTFLSGSLMLRSNVQIHLEKGAVLLGSDLPQHYVHVALHSWCGNGWKSLIIADGATNIGIHGKGTINGQGCSLGLRIDSLFYAGDIDSKYYEREKRVVAHKRPQLIRLVQCTNVLISGITLEDAASWVQTYEQCTNLEIDNIRVLSTAYWNNDGMDIMDCKNVRITNCFVNSADDGICLKSFSQDTNWFCDNIYIGNCTVRSSASAIKLGTSSYSGFKNIIIENIKVYDTYRSAIAIESVEGGFIENVLVQNIRAVNTGNAIFIRLGLKEAYAHRPMGSVRNVIIRDVKVSVPYDQPDFEYNLRGPALPFFHNVFPASIAGIPGYPVENIVLENIIITYPGKGNACYANLPLWRLQDVPEEIGAYPEFSMFGELPAWAFYVRHVDGLTMRNLQVKIKKPDYRPAFVFDDVNALELESIVVKGDVKKDAFIFRDVGNIKEDKK